MRVLNEFKNFILRGNVLDLAVGIVIGAAFGAIVTAVVDNILMPLVGIATGGINFKTLSVKVGSAELQYGLFIQAAVIFIIIAFFLFLIVKAANRMKIKTTIQPPISSTDELLIKINNELVLLRREMANKK